eukprot:gene5318-7382_t
MDSSNTQNVQTSVNRDNSNRKSNSYVLTKPLLPSTPKSISLGSINSGNVSSNNNNCSNSIKSQLKNNFQKNSMPTKSAEVNDGDVNNSFENKIETKVETLQDMVRKYNKTPDKLQIKLNNDDNNPNKSNVVTSIVDPTLSPPLPLFKFESVTVNETDSPKTIINESIKSIGNNIDPSTLPKISPRDYLHNPIYAKRLSKWFSARSYKEVNLKQMEFFQQELYLKNEFQADNNDDSNNSSSNNINQITKPDLFDYVVYESIFHNESIDDRVARNSNRLTEDKLICEKLSKMDIFNGLIVNEVLQTAVRRNSKDKDNISSPKESNNNTNSNNSSNEMFYKNNYSSSNPTIINGLQNASIIYTSSLLFDGEFESGNIEKATRVYGRNSLMTARTLDRLHGDYAIPKEVDQEYDIVLRKEGNIQWYYFSVQTPIIPNEPATPNNTKELQRNQSFSFPSPIKYPLRVRFNIVNFQKSDSLYNYGMKPALYSVYNNNDSKSPQDWIHSGEDICYYKNGNTYVNSKKKTNKKIIKYYYSLSFTYTFEQPDTVYFAHTFPYTYSDLQKYLSELENNSLKSQFIHRRLLCTSLVGNRCDVLNITERSQLVIADRVKPSIIISARVHPGESNSSYVIQGLIDFLLSNEKEAIKLRKSFVFTIVPMLNPDGVIHGNYRCSLSGTDLNRRYSDTHFRLHPTIYAMKKLISTAQNNRGVLLYIDLHGHSRLKNSFVYGCDMTLLPEKNAKVMTCTMQKDDIDANRIYARTFPKILSMISDSNNNGYFSFKDCSFAIDKSKFGTGRVVTWRDLGVVASYTIEMSFCGNGDNSEEGLLKKMDKESTNISNNNNNNVMGIVYSSTSNDNNDINDNKIVKDSIGISSPRLSNNRNQLRPKSAIPSKLSNSNNSNILLLNNINNIQTSTPRDNSDNNNRRNTLLEKYSTASHYTKHNLFAAGRDIGLSIYHFANLSHSDLNNELKIASELDQEMKLKKISMLPSKNNNNNNNNDDYYINPALINNLNNKHSNNIKDDNHNMINAMPILSTVKLGGVKPATIEISSDEDDEDDGSIPDESDEDKSTGDTDNSNDDKKVVNNNNINNNNELEIKKLKMNMNNSSNIELVKETMINRSHLKPTIYTSESIQTCLGLYPYAFSNINQMKTNIIYNNNDNNNNNNWSHSTIGLRMKAEYNIRKLLKLDDQISHPLTEETLSLFKQENNIDLLENEKVEGSESDPSADNIPVNQMLKTLKKMKDPANLVLALKKVASKQKKQQLLLLKKKEKKDKKLRLKQEEDAKKAYLEALALTNIDINNNSNNQDNNNSKLDKTNDERFTIRKRISAHQGLPKFIPNYRLAPEERITVPLQIKTVNFKDFDEANYLSKINDTTLSSQFPSIMNQPVMISSPPFGSNNNNNNNNFFGNNDNNITTFINERYNTVNGSVNNLYDYKRPSSGNNYNPNNNNNNNNNNNYNSEFSTLTSSNYKYNNSSSNSNNNNMLMDEKSIFEPFNSIKSNHSIITPSHLSKANKSAALSPGPRSLVSMIYEELEQPAFSPRTASINNNNNNNNSNIDNNSNNINMKSQSSDSDKKLSRSHSANRRNNNNNVNTNNNNNNSNNSNYYHSSMLMNGDYSPYYLTSSSTKESNVSNSNSAKINSSNGPIADAEKLLKAVYKNSTNNSSGNNYASNNNHTNSNNNTPVRTSTSSNHKTRNKSLHQIGSQLPKSLEEYFENLNNESSKRKQRSFVYTAGSSSLSPTNNGTG